MNKKKVRDIDKPLDGSNWAVLILLIVIGFFIFTIIFWPLAILQIIYMVRKHERSKLLGIKKLSKNQHSKEAKKLGNISLYLGIISLMISLFLPSLQINIILVLGSLLGLVAMITGIMGMVKGKTTAGM